MEEKWYYIMLTMIVCFIFISLTLTNEQFWVGVRLAIEATR